MNSKCALLLVGVACLMGAAPVIGYVVVTDDFSDRDHLSNPAWAVGSGDFTSDGTQALGSLYGIDQVLNFGTAAGTQIYLDFGPIPEHTTVKVEFRLFQVNGAAGGSYWFKFGLADSVALALNGFRLQQTEDE